MWETTESKCKYLKDGVVWHCISYIGIMSHACPRTNASQEKTDSAAESFTTSTDGNIVWLLPY